MEKALEYANKVLDLQPTDYEMIMLAARYWSSLNDVDKTYYYACRAVENYPQSIPELPDFAYWILKIFTIFPKLRNLDKEARKSFAKHKNRRLQDLKWAHDFIKWYEAKYKPERKNYN